jgi:hypothetical protein
MEKPRTYIVRGLRWRRLLPLDADCEIQVDVFVRDKAVPKVPGKARVAGGVNAFRDRPPQQSVSVGGLDDVQRHPTTMAGGETFYVRAEGALVILADRSAHSERDKGNGQGNPFAEGNRSTTLHLEQGSGSLCYSTEAGKESELTK